MDGLQLNIVKPIVALATLESFVGRYPTLILSSLTQNVILGFHFRPR